jgi:hypothetical protein
VRLRRWNEAWSLPEQPLTDEEMAHGTLRVT